MGSDRGLEALPAALHTLVPASALALAPLCLLEGGGCYQSFRYQSAHKAVPTFLLRTYPSPHPLLPPLALASLITCPLSFSLTH